MFLTRDSEHVALEWRPDLAALIPHAREFEHETRRMLLVPNRHDEAKLARNLGLAFPAPIMTRYDWPGKFKPWDAQKTTSALLTESSRAYVLNTMGTGKTASVIWAADFLQRQHVGPVLISAPVSTLNAVWERELFDLVPTKRVRVLYGSKERRLKLLAEKADFYIINHHGLGVINEALARKRFSIIVIDELAVFRNKSTGLWKAADRLINPKDHAGPDYAWGLTGSPTPTAPTDAWGQIRLLTPARTTKSLTQFRDQTMKQLSQFKWVARADANDTVQAAMQPSVRYTREQIVELPPTSFQDRVTKLSSKAAEAYRLLFDKMRAATNSGKSITAANEAVLQGKLLQVAMGFIYADDRTVYRLPAEERLAAVEEVVSECDRKVIVFVPFIHALEGVAEHLTKAGHKVAVVHGGTAFGQRNKIFRDFQEAGEPKVLVAHPQCMAHGLTLTSANTIVWYGPANSLEIYEQANARITRPGQTSKSLILHLSGTPVERQTYARLRQRSKMQGMLLDLFKHQALEF